MPAEPRNRTIPRQALAGIGLTALLLALLALPAEPAMAAKTRDTLVQPSSTGEAKTARQALLKQRTAVIAVRHPQPGKIVGGTSAPVPKTIATKRILPK